MKNRVSPGINDSNKDAIEKVLSHKPQQHKGAYTGRASWRPNPAKL